MASSSSSSSPPANESLLQRPKLSLAFLSHDHYQEWVRMQRKRNRLSETIGKFLIQFFTYTGETVSLIATLILGVLIPTKDTEETYVAILLYFLSCGVTFAVGWGNKTRTISRDSNSIEDAVSTPKSRINCWGIATTFLFMVVKPFRYVKLFVVRRKKLAIIRDGEKITEQGLKAMNALDTAELEDSIVELHEAFFHSMPMMILQTYFLFKTHQQFTLCDLEDLSRLSHIFMTIVQAGKCAVTYEAAKANYEASLHFLSFFKSGGAHPLRIYSSDMLSLTGWANFVCHVLTICCRFYIATYFLVISWMLSAIFLISTFLTNLFIIKLFPHVFLEILENAPFGVATTASYYTDRYINVFCNVGTRFNKFSEEITVLSERNKRWWFRLPLVLVQLLHFVIPLAIVYGMSGLFGGGSNRLEPSAVATTLNETFSQCPEVKEWYDANDFSRAIGSSLFSVYRTLNDRFSSFNDIFNMVHMIWLLFYCQILFTAVFSYADLMRRRRNPATVPRDESNYFDDSYPILTGYSFWEVLIDQVLKGHNNNEWERVKMGNRVRMLMLLTILGKDEFYRVTRFARLFPRRSLSVKKVMDEVANLVDRLTESDEEIEVRIQECFDQGHVFSERFAGMRQVLALGNGSPSRKDKKLFLAFFANFDLKMYTLRSDKVKRVFDFVGWKRERGCCRGNGIPMKYFEED